PAHAERGAGVPGTNDFGKGFDGLFAARIKDADEFYASRIPEELSADARNVMRQSYAGMLWSKQFYHYDVQTWLEGDPAGPVPPGAFTKLNAGSVASATAPSLKGFFTNCSSISLGGSIAKIRKARTSFRAGSWASITSASSIAPRPSPLAAISSNPTVPAGWA